jgi:hypothetical protein
MRQMTGGGGRLFGFFTRWLRRQVFKGVFRGLADPNGRLKRFDLVSMLINSHNFGLEGPLAMINSMLEADRIEGLPGGYYREIRKGDEGK